MRNLLKQIAEEMLGLSGLNPNKDLLHQVQYGFQNSIKKYFGDSKLEQDTRNLTDEQILHLVAVRSEMKNKNTPQIARQIPKYSLKYPMAGFECTLSTALVRLSLAKMGFNNTRSLLLRRHFIAMRELEDGSIKLYDAATRITVNGQIQGFCESFFPREVYDKHDVWFQNEKRGYVFTIKTTRKIKNTNMFQKNNNGFYLKQFFAYEPNILIDLSVVLENLSEITKQKDEFSIKLCADYPILKKLDYPRMKVDLGMFDAYDFL